MSIPNIDQESKTITTEQNETKQPFTCYIEERHSEYVPYARHQPPSPPERLMFRQTMHTSLPRNNLKFGILPERPLGFGSTSYNDSTQRHRNHNSTRTLNNGISSHASSSSNLTESNEYVLLLGGIAVANISTTGSGEGLVQGLNIPAQSHPFCRCTIIPGIAIPAQQIILQTVFQSRHWFKLLRSFVRMGFLLAPKQCQPRVLSAVTLWDMMDFPLPKHSSHQRLTDIAPQMFRRAEGETTKTPEPWPIQYPLSGGNNLCIHSMPQRRQRCYITSFRFAKVTGHLLNSKFMSLDQNRSIQLLYEGRPLQRCRGCLLDQKEGSYKTLGNDCATESKFQHQHISIVEFINTDLDKLRDHLVQQSPIINAFHHTKDQRFSKVVSHLREIGIRLHDSLPKYIDKKCEEYEKELKDFRSTRK